MLIQKYKNKLDMYVLLQFLNHFMYTFKKLITNKIHTVLLRVYYLTCLSHCLE